MVRHAGGCHCQAVRLTFDSDAPLRPRACGCGFCRRHGARMVSDPNGHADIEPGDGAIRYRFGTHTTDYLLCGRCGTYVGAFAAIAGRTFATLNLNSFDDPALHLVGEPIDYAGESAEAKAERRLRLWTPVAIGTA